MGKKNKNRGYRSVLVKQNIPRATEPLVPQPPNIMEAIPKGNKVIVFMVPFVDSCVDKIVGEYGPLFARDNISFVVAPDNTSYNEVLRVAPELIVLFRAGTQNITNKEYAEGLKQLIGYCRILKVPTVYYADDFVFPVNSGLPLQIAANSARIITATPVLKNWLYEAGVMGPIAVVPTHVDLEYFDKQPMSALVDPDRFNILIGSTGRIGKASATILASYLNNEPERYKNVTLVMVSHGIAYMREALNQFRNIDKVYSEVLPQDQYYSLCKSCAVHLMVVDSSDISYMIPPEFHSIWLNSKSPIKYCLAGASNSIFMGSPLVPFVGSVRHGETGFLTSTAEEVLTYIDALIEKPQFGISIVKQARKDVEEHWDIKATYQRFKDALYGLENWDVPSIRDINTPHTKIGWLLCGPNNIASARIEGINLHNWLTSKEVNSSILLQPEGFRHHLTLEKSQMDDIIKAGYDTVVFQKLFSGDVPPLVQKLNACGIRTVWSISDLVEQGMVMSKLCEKVVLTTEYLKGKLPPDVLGKVTIIKDAYESPKELCKEEYSPVGEKLRVLWFGSTPHYDEAKFLKEIVEGLDMEYFMISTADKSPNKVWSESEIFADIMRADIVVIPSTLSEFDKCKDENRLVQCMVLGLPTVSSPIPAYLDVVKEGTNGYIANSMMDWVKKLSILTDQGTRERIGKQARLDVVEKYHIDIIGEQWVEVLTR